MSGLADATSDGFICSAIFANLTNQVDKLHFLDVSSVLWADWILLPAVRSHDLCIVGVHCDASLLCFFCYWGQLPLGRKSTKQWRKEARSAKYILRAVDNIFNGVGFCGPCSFRMYRPTVHLLLSTFVSRCDISTMFH